jgi:SAM-dependent methyltransferase
MDDARKEVVRDGYNRVADRYAAWGQAVVGDPRDRFLAQFSSLLHVGGTVLDLGCGAGLPSTALLARHFKVTGVDISGEQIRRARVNVPQARFVVGDFTSSSFDRPFDGVTALYSIAHVPREEHRGLFRRIASWLVPSGVFLASLGATDSPDWTGEWLGVPMFFSSYGVETNRQLLAEAGFHLIVDELVTMREPEGSVAFQWVIAKMPLR